MCMEPSDWLPVGAGGGAGMWSGDKWQRGVWSVRKTRKEWRLAAGIEEGVGRRPKMERGVYK